MSSKSLLDKYLGGARSKTSAPSSDYHPPARARKKKRNPNSHGTGMRVIDEDDDGWKKPVGGGMGRGDDDEVEEEEEGPTVVPGVDVEAIKMQKLKLRLLQSREAGGEDHEGDGSGQSSGRRRRRHDSDSEDEERRQEASSQNWEERKGGDVSAHTGGVDDDDGGGGGGATHQTIYRDKYGRKIKPPTREEQEAAERSLKLQEIEDEHKRQKWNMGRKQLEDRENASRRLTELKAEAFAGTRDDKVWNEQLKATPRWGDPATAAAKRKEKKPPRPIYDKPFPPNRFKIRPGFRWDGVDRSNGYEKSLFLKRNESVARAEAAYKWSSEDM